MTSRRPHHALAVAGLAGISLVWLWHVAFNTASGRWLDGAVLQGFTGLRTGRTAPVADFLVRLCDPRPFFVAWVLLMAVAVLRRRFGAALIVAVVLPAANLATQILKPALAEPRVHGFLVDGQVAAASWPSGHSTAAMTLALALVLVAPARWRPLAAAVGGTFALVVTFSIVLLGWHYPSDVLGGFGIATLGFSLGLAALWAVRGLRAPGRGAGVPPATFRPAAVLADLGAPLVAGSALAAAAAGVILTRLPQAIAYAQAHTAFVVGATMMGALALVLSGAFAALVRSR